MLEYRVILNEHDAHESSVPEQRLWCAIILSALTEYETLLRSRNSSKPLRKQCEGAWFRHVCDCAGVEHSVVIRKLDQLDAKYGGMVDTLGSLRKKVIHRAR